MDDYVAAVKKGKSALVVSPTHAQGAQVTASIRAKLRSAGLIGKKELTAKQLSNLNLTNAQKADWRSFGIGQSCSSTRTYPGIKRGSSWTIDQASETEVQLKNREGQTVSLPTQKSSTYDVYQPSTISLSKGDTVRVTRNGFDEAGKAAQQRPDVGSGVGAQEREAGVA